MYVSIFSLFAVGAFGQLVLCEPQYRSAAVVFVYTTVRW